MEKSWEGSTEKVAAQHWCQTKLKSMKKVHCKKSHPFQWVNSRIHSLKGTDVFRLSATDLLSARETGDRIWHLSASFSLSLTAEKALATSQTCCGIRWAAYGSTHVSTHLSSCSINFLFISCAEQHYNKICKWKFITHTREVTEIQLLHETVAHYCPDSDNSSSNCCQETPWYTKRLCKL